MNHGRRISDQPKLTTAQTFARVNQVAAHFKVEPISLMWAVEFINGLTDEFEPDGPNSVHTCTFMGCNRKAYLEIPEEQAFRCVHHAWRADESTGGGYMIQYTHLPQARFFSDVELRFLS